MALRTQAWWCFAAAALALIGLPESVGDKYFVAGLAVLAGGGLWVRDGQRRQARAARQAELVESDDDGAADGDGDGDEDEDERDDEETRP